MPEPEPPTATPPLATAASVPDGTERVTSTLPAPASTSAIETPVRTQATSSVTVIETGTVFTGASFTALTVMLTTSLSVSTPPAPAKPRSLVRMVRLAGPL